MAWIRLFSLCFHYFSLVRRKNSWRTLIFLGTLAVCFSPAPSLAQFPQPLVFSSAGGVAVRNDQTGALAPAGSPLTPSTETAFALDVQGRFLFAVGGGAIHMFQITDSTTGAYSEVCGSPFASQTTHQPLFIAVEPTGQFIAVVDLVGQNPGDASVETFSIVPSTTVLCPGSTVGPALIPVAGSATELDSTPVGFAQPPGNKSFLLFLGPNPLSQNITIAEGSEFQSLSINSTSGFIAGLQPNSATNERGLSFAMDPQGRYYATGTQDNLLETGSISISGLDGKIVSRTLPLLTSNFPEALWIDSSGSFLYAAISDLNNPIVVRIYSLNFQTSQLTEMPSSPLPGFNAVPPYAPDPTGAFNYGFANDPNTAIAFTVDPLTGYFVQTANSPFSVPQISGSLTFSIPPGQQGISGPSAALSATSLSFGALQTGMTSAPQVVTLTSNGGEALSVNSIALSGADPTQFSESDTCQVPTVLQPTKFCTISIAFAPSSAGSQQATLVITDNATDSPQSVQLGGTGATPPPPAPAVSINPNPLTFSTLTLGTTSNPATISVTNSGNATLHITSVLLAGNNPSDFNMSSTCNGPYAPNASCTLRVTFTPLAAGQRSATITITDDAQNSPQVLQVTGTATPGQPTTPLVNLSSASLNFGAVTQGSSSANQSVTLSNVGGAALHISSIALAGANPSDYTLSNGCTASPYAVNATCVLTVSFAPLSTGVRSATILITDDAPNSPQTITLNGTANAAVTIGTAPNGSTSATVSAGQTATYNLQITPGPGFTGIVSFACSGAPLAASCQVPASVQVSNGVAAAFTVSVTTTGAAGAAPPRFVRFTQPSRWQVFEIEGVLISLVFLFLAARITKRRGYSAPRVLALGTFCSGVAVVLMIGASGCGGGAQTIAPPAQQPTITPQGAFMLTVTPSATSVSGKPLQLPPIQLTLNVTN